MNRKVCLLFFCLIGLFINKAAAAKVDTVETMSISMHKKINAVVITPDGYDKNAKYPVVYLLHGFSDNYTAWIKKVPHLKNICDQYKFIIVCPDGGFSSWYMDSPEKADYKYETYISKELVAFVDSNYATVKDRSGRAIAGLSMGGFGALYLAIKHQDIYGAVGSMSGGVDLRPFAKSFGINQILGDYNKYPQRWADNSIIEMLPLLKPASLAITIDDGASDFFLEVNNQLHTELLKDKIDHDYSIRPGGHTWDFWSNAVDYQMLFFSRFFKKNEDEKAAENFANLMKFYDNLLHVDWPNIAKYQDDNAKVAVLAGDEKKVVFMGNSITENWYSQDPAFFQTNHYIGRGIGGQVSSQMLVRFREDVIDLKPMAVVIEAGTNDIAENRGPISLENVFGNIVSMVQLAQASHIVPIIGSVLPATEFSWHRGLEPAQKIMKLNAMLKEYARKNHVIYIDYWSAMVNDKKGLKPELTMDGLVHPNIAGYKVMEPLVQAAILQATK
jgi:S-formylglutathione hydrolase FrmB/lysophospholipase L1-like esterase